jgi:dTDP-4-amino-4,6-dideoxygalactose transaminase
MVAPMTTYVPTFQGLSAFELVRPAVSTPPCFPFTAERLGFYRARNAIYYLFEALRSLNPSLDVLVPDYNSGNEILALKAAGATLHYYRIGRDMQPDVDHIAELCRRHDPDVLYVIHYLGWPQPLDTLSRLCRERAMLLVEDCALSLLSEPGGQPLGASGDFSVFCLYKTLPVPNGSVLVQNKMPLGALGRLRLRRAGAASVLGRVAELVVQRTRAQINGVGAILQSAKRALGKAAGALEVNRSKVGDIGFNFADVDLQMSPASERLLRRFDFGTIRRKRVNNFHTLAQALDGKVTPAQPHLPEGACPLFFPIVVRDKAATAHALRGHGVQALEFWNHGAEGADDVTFANAQFLRSHVLALPVHQDLSARQLAHMVDRVSALNLQFQS